MNFGITVREHCLLKLLNMKVNGKTEIMMDMEFLQQMVVLDMKDNLKTENFMVKEK